MKPSHKIILILAALVALFILRGPDGGTNRTPITITR